MPPDFETRSPASIGEQETMIPRLLLSSLDRDPPRETRLSDRRIELDGLDPAYGPLELSSVRGIDGWLEVDTSRSR